MTQNNPASDAKRLLETVEKASGINKLLAVMSALRDPQGGCPWDIKQSYDTILPYTIEEVYEVAEAIETQDYESLKDELGDLLFQVVFYAQIAKEDERFEFNDIVDGICSKLVRRHPHVFSDETFDDEQALNQAWEEQKHRERNAKLVQANLANDSEEGGKSANQATNSSVLEDIPKALPELKRAHKIQKRAAKVGFDWQNVDQVWAKVLEEKQEVQEAAASGDRQHLEEELGDLLFALVNLTRHYGVDADLALRKANQKFSTRFRQVEQLSNYALEGRDIEELEALWQQAKQIVGETKS
ncbi:nucleoside triphosphate pyrophosphohydrolase [Aliikangiella marina]|uniref:Nucleoside triphosphate pyrophosphohydrolase n=1 Tax=Aliikangiella marina TaxID=1712262 RepID=A0A545T2X5_9GAMM|nr:nucleoside triphosphate pyrophosphohydrolase [Aliikangiella marina]TQV71577.1 nucleoside triphosphate pyrophosphohydrolase [Aliikangiella marina]